MKLKRFAAIPGLAGAVVFIAASVISIVMFERGTYSPMNCFVTELGHYANGFMTASSALVFNTGLMLSGVLLGVFMVMYGLRNDAPFNNAVSFFGVLTGILMIAEGLFSLNYYTYHYILASAFFVSLFIMCVLYVVSIMLSGSRKSTAPAVTVAAILAGAAAALSSIYMISGGMAQIFTEDASGIGRENVIPFAVIGWAAYALLFMFTAVLAVSMLAEKEHPASASSSAGLGNNKKQPKPKRSSEAPRHSYR